MPNSSVETNENDFVLKHRIAGAAFLLFFGALVLPWLLGPPSEAKKNPVSEIVPEVTETVNSEISEDLENEILAELQETIEEDEQVYISKITPEGKVSQLISKKDEAKKIEQEKAAELAKVTAAEKQKELERQAALKEKELKAKEQSRKEALAKEKKEKALQAQASKETNSVDSNESVQTETVSEEERKRIASAELSAALEAESATVEATITSGWVVQVGMFVDKKKANNVFRELGEKGFKPSTSVVDTNLGLKTGTRVWLGPFKERQEAVDMKSKLADKTGTSGFIRAYP